MSIESAFYDENVPESLSARLVYHAEVAVRVAQLESRNWPDFELDAVPYLRRLNMQSGLMFATYPRGVQVEIDGHQGGHHAVIRSGRVTISAQTRSRMPVAIDGQPYFKTITMARNPQESLFPEEPANRELLWGLLIFGAQYRSTGLELCRMTFPDMDGNFAPGTIDLLDQHADVVARFDDKEYAAAQIQRFLRLRLDAQA